MLKRIAAAVGGLLLVALMATPAAAITSDIACAPAPGEWSVAGAFSNGDVMEYRACVSYSTDYSIGLGRSAAGRVEWRLRNGTTPISNAIWDYDAEDGAGGNCYNVHLERVSPYAIMTYSTGTCSDVVGSYINNRTPYDCDHTYALANYWGRNVTSHGMRVYNPRTGTKSGWKYAESFAANIDISCG